MLDLYNLLWVLPGVVFIFIYNKRRSVHSIELSGWPYIFFLVFVAALIWIPIEYFVYSFKYFSKAGNNVIIVSSSMFLSALLAIWCAWSETLRKFLIPSSYDSFLTSCIDLENKPVIVSLKNDKIYVGILLKHPENSNSAYELQSISIIPLVSGGRSNNTKEVHWGSFYPERSEEDSCEVVIPRQEIVTFGQFSPAVFSYFYEIGSKEEKA